MKKQRKRTPLVVEHLEGISRSAISRFPELVTEFARGKSGVYALYKGASLYYVGLAKNLRSRLHHHLIVYSPGFTMQAPRLALTERLKKARTLAEAL